MKSATHRFRRPFLAALASFVTGVTMLATVQAAPTSKPASQTKAQAAQAQGWVDGNLKQALELAKGTKPILMQVHAHWCGPCNQLTYEVIDTPTGRKLLKQAVGIRVDFETQDGREVTKRYGVLGLPTTLVLTPKGEEIGRVLGYGGRRYYLSAINDALAGKKGFKAVQADFKKDPKNPRKQLAYAQALLHKGKTAEAKKLLTGMMVKGNPLAGSAFRIWGRWLVRVQRKGKEGAEHFERAMQFFKGTRYALGYRYWAAKGWQVAGKPKKAMALFDGWIKQQPNNVGAQFAKVDFMVHYKYPPKQTLPLIKKVLKRSPNNSWMLYLLAQVEEQAKNKKAALAAINKACKLSPHSAMFKFYKKRLMGQSSH